MQFNKASLRRVNFDNANLSGTSMFGALCSGCTFKGANLRCALPSRCTVTYAKHFLAAQPCARPL